MSQLSESYSSIRSSICSMDLVVIGCVLQNKVCQEKNPELKYRKKVEGLDTSFRNGTLATPKFIWNKKTAQQIFSHSIVMNEADITRKDQD